MAVVAALLALAALLQAAVIASAVMPALDAIEFVTVAQAIATDGWLATLRTEPQPPMFATLVYLAHSALTKCQLVDAENWALPAQLVAGGALVLSVGAVYLVWRKLIGTRAAAWAAALFCLLPEVAVLGADGLSDSTHLLLACLALLAAVSWCCSARHGAAWRDGWLLACGLLAGLALTARAEVIVLLPAIVVAVLVDAVRRSRNRPHELRQGIAAPCVQSLRSLAALASGLALVLVPYLMASDCLAPDRAFARISGRQAPRDDLPLNRPAMAATLLPTDSLHDHSSWLLADGEPMVFGRKDYERSSRFHGLLAALAELVHELIKQLHYWIGGLAAYGLIRRRLRLGTPADVLLWSMAISFVAAVSLVSSQSGYLAGRHLLLLVVLTIGWAPLGAAQLVDDVRRAVDSARLRWSQRRGDGARRLPSREAFISCLLLVSAAACLPSALSPAHGVRRPHRQAAAWLRERGDGGGVLDPVGLTALYTGRTTYRGEAAAEALCHPGTSYIVVEQRDLTTATRRGRSLQTVLQIAGVPEVRFEPARGDADHAVLVYRWMPDRFADSLPRRTSYR